MGKLGIVCTLVLFVTGCISGPDTAGQGIEQILTTPTQLAPTSTIEPTIAPTPTHAPEPTPTATPTTTSTPAPTPTPTPTPTPPFIGHYRFEDNSAYGYTMLLPVGWELSKTDDDINVWHAMRFLSPRSGDASGAMLAILSSSLEGSGLEQGSPENAALQEYHDTVTMTFLDGFISAQEVVPKPTVSEGQLTKFQGRSLVSSLVTGPCSQGTAVSLFSREKDNVHFVFAFHSTCPESNILTRELELMQRFALEALL